MKNKKCKYPKCDCKLITIVVDNMADILSPMSVADFTQTTYQKKECKYDK